MPKKPSPRTLRQICLFYLVENVDYYANIRCHIESYGPFYGLPSNLLDELVKLLTKHHAISERGVLNRVIIPGLKKIRLSAQNANTALELVATRCKDLQHLQILGNYVMDDNFASSIRCFTSLQELSLLYFNMTPRLMNILGQHSRHLKLLDFTSCGVDDSALRVLLQGYTGTPQPNRCPNLERLILLGTRVTPRSVKLALMSLPKLTKMEFENTASAIDDLCRFNPDRRFRIIDLYMDMEDCKRDTLEICIRACPRLTQVTFLKAFVVDHSLMMPLRTLDKLTHLAVEGLGSLDYTSFTLCMAPILNHHGATMHTVELGDVPTVDIQALADICPNLEQLNMRTTRRYIHDDNRAPPTMAHLKHVVILSHPNSPCPGNVLRWIMSHSPSLQSAAFQDCPDIDDAFLDEVILGGARLPNMNHFELVRCQSVSSRAVIRLLKTPSPLDTIKLHDCYRLKKDRDVLRDVVIYGKHDVSLELTLTVPGQRKLTCQYYSPQCQQVSTHDTRCMYSMLQAMSASELHGNGATH